MHLHRLVTRRTAHLLHQERIAIVMLAFGIVITAAASIQDLLA